MQRRFVGLLGSVLMTASACGPAGDVPAATVTDSAGVAVTFSSAPQWGDSAKWIVGEVKLAIGESGRGEAYEFVHVISAVRLSDNRVMVVHSNSPPGVRLYDAEGEHLRTVGRAGAGPGEFRGLLRAWRTRGDSLVGYDPILGRLTQFDGDGTIGRVVPVGVAVSVDGSEPAPAWFDRFGDGTLLGRPNSMVPGPDGPTRPRFAYSRFDPATGHYDTLALALAGQYRRGSSEGHTYMQPVVFGPFSSAIAGDTTMLLADSRDYWIEELDLSGAVLRRFGRSWVPRSVTPDEISEYRASRLARADSDEERRFIEEDLSSTPFAESHPAHRGGLVLDRLGNLWVAEVPSESAQRWSVFSKDRVWLGLVETPLRLRITEIGAAELIGVWRDELDVQSVRIYELSRESV